MSTSEARERRDRSDSGAAAPTALEILRGYLGEQSTVFLAQLPRLREGRPDASHKVRVACRRARSMLRSFRPLLDGDWADELGAQIAEFTDLVGPQRDLEVVRERLFTALDELGDGSLGAVRARSLLDRQLQREAAAAREVTLAALAGPRFHALADRFALAPNALPGRPESDRPASETLIPLAAETYALVARRVAALPDPRAQSARTALSDEATDLKWHRLRIAAKRCRYATEVCVPVGGRPAASFAQQMTRITEELGVQQDATLVSAVLLRAADTPRIAAPTGFVLGRLLGDARAGMLRSRLAFPGLWKQVADPAHRAWLGPLPSVPAQDARAPQEPRQDRQRPDRPLQDRQLAATMLNRAPE